MNKTKTTMEDVAATFGDFEQKVDTKIADMDREQLAYALRSIVRIARDYAEDATKDKDNSKEAFEAYRTISSAVRLVLRV